MLVASNGKREQEKKWCEKKNRRKEKKVWEDETNGRRRMSIRKRRKMRCGRRIRRNKRKRTKSKRGRTRRRRSSMSAFNTLTVKYLQFTFFFYVSCCKGRLTVITTDAKITTSDSFHLPSCNVFWISIVGRPKRSFKAAVILFILLELKWSEATASRV